MDARVIAHRFTIGTVLADAIRVYVRQFPKLMLVSLVLLPLAAFGPLLLTIEIESPTYAQVIVPALSDVVLNISALVAEASAVIVVLHHLRGRPTSYRDLLVWVPAAGTVILGGLLVWLPDFIGRTGYYTLASLYPDSEWMVALPYYVGLAVYVGVLIFWLLFVPVVVAERAGLGSALTRSAQLGKGERWRIFALLLILLVAGLATMYGLYIVIYMNGGAISWSLADLPTTLAYNGAFGLYTMFSSSVSITMLHHLRLREEGMDSGRAITAFD